MSDLAFFAVGGSVGAIAVILLGWALFWDRARGRRRCPKCWYDIVGESGIDARLCPECGHRARSDRRLRKTRRRRGWALLAVLLVIASTGLVATPVVRERGWTDLAPTTVLIMFIPTIDAPKHEVLVELSDRFEIEDWRYRRVEDRLGLRHWQRRLLVDRCDDALAPDRHQNAQMFALTLLPACGPEAASCVDRLDGLLKRRMHVYLVARVIGQLGPPAAPCVPSLVLLMEPNNRESYQAAAIRALGRIGPEASEAVPGLIQCVRARPGEDRYEQSTHGAAVVALGQIGPNAADALPHLVSVVRDASSPFRAPAVTAIGAIDVAPPESQAIMLAAIGDSEVGVREAAASVIEDHADLHSHVVGTLTRELDASEPLDRIVAARGLMAIGPIGSEAVPTLVRRIDDTDPTVRLFVLRALREIGEAARAAVGDVELAMTDDDPAVRREARALHQILSKGAADAAQE